jgi:hypothetical protein
MGVLNCDRYACKHIMCDHFSHKFGYLCNNCFDELKAKKPKTEQEIQEFLDTAPNSDSDPELNLEEIFQTLNDI